MNESLLCIVWIAPKDDAHYDEIETSLMQPPDTSLDTKAKNVEENVRSDSLKKKSLICFNLLKSHPFLKKKTSWLRRTKQTYWAKPSQSLNTVLFRDRKLFTQQIRIHIYDQISLFQILICLFPFLKNFFFIEI